MTFTAPNWETVPRAGVEEITSQQPAHPAASFYYPDRTEHPPIATLTLTKVESTAAAGDCDQATAGAGVQRDWGGLHPRQPGRGQR